MLDAAAVVVESVLAAVAVEAAETIIKAMLASPANRAGSVASDEPLLRLRAGLTLLTTGRLSSELD